MDWLKGLSSGLGGVLPAPPRSGGNFSQNPYAMLAFIESLQRAMVNKQRNSPYAPGTGYPTNTIAQPVDPSKMMQQPIDPLKNQTQMPVQKQSPYPVGGFLLNGRIPIQNQFGGGGWGGSGGRLPGSVMSVIPGAVNTAPWGNNPPPLPNEGMYEHRPSRTSAPGNFMDVINRLLKR